MSIWWLGRRPATARERFRLAKRMDDALFSFHEALNSAVYRANPQSHFQRADIQLNLLRAYFRLALELKYTSPNQFHFASEQMAELGRLLGGWKQRHRQS